MAKTLLIEWKELGCKAHIQLLWDQAPKPTGHRRLFAAAIRQLALGHIRRQHRFRASCGLHEVREPAAPTRGNMYIYANGQSALCPMATSRNPRCRTSGPDRRQ